MSDLTHIFKVGQKVKIKNEEFGKIWWTDGVVTETYADHIIVHETQFDCNLWFENGFNIGNVYPDYNFNF